LFLSGCGFGFVHDETLVGRYKLVAVDTDEQMSLCWSLDSGNCVGDGLPGPTVFAAGFDDKYVVAAVHPHESNRSITQYFYVIRDKRNEDSDDSGLSHSRIRGPFSPKDYEIEKARLKLPEFTRIIESLR